MDDLYYCIRIMQISTDKLQLPRNTESLHRTSLIRSTFLQSRKHFCDLLCSFIKISSTTNTLLPVIIPNDDRQKFLSYEQTIVTLNKSSGKRKSCHIDTVKRLRLSSSSSSVTAAAATTAAAASFSDGARIEKQNVD